MVQANVTLLIFYPDDLCIAEIRLLKAPIITALSLSLQINICTIYLHSLMFNLHIFFLNQPFYHYTVTFFVSYHFWLKSILSGVSIANCTFFSICIEYFFMPSLSIYVCS